MRRLEIISTGGTIEKVYDEAVGKLVNRRSIVRRMLGRLRLTDAEVEHRVLMHKDSLELTDEDRGSIVRTVRFALEVGVDGVVVLHGTDTLAQTGELLHAEIAKHGGARAPVVLTGAFRPFEMRQTDALQNLTEALFATSLLPGGVYCVVHGQALAFPGVVKDRQRQTFIRDDAPPRHPAEPAME